MFKKTIAFYGCSHTHGMMNIDKQYNYVKYLSEQYPQYRFLNFAYRGSSVLFQLYCLQCALKVNPPIDHHIFQLTTSGRMTFWPDKFKPVKALRHHSTNYWQFDFIEDMHIHVYSHKFPLSHFSASGQRSRPLSSDSIEHHMLYNFGELYYYYLTDDHADIEYKVLSNYASKHVDYIFVQRPIAPNALNISIPCVENCLTQQELVKFWYKAGDTHFTKQGHIWEGEWLIEQLKYKNIF